MAYKRLTAQHRAIPAFNEQLETPDKENAQFDAALRIQMSDSHPDYPAMMLANYMLGGTISSRVPNRIRNKEGLSYGARTGFTAPSEGDAAVFSASVIAYQLLTRQLPYDCLGGKVPAAADSNHPEIPLIAASQRSPYRSLMRDEFWRRIDQILARGLAFQPKNRFVNGDAWLSEIESLNAMLKLQTKLPPWKENLLNTFDWFAGWFRRS